MLAGRGRLRQPSVASCVGGDGWATSVFASPALLMSELPQTLKVGAGLCRPQEPAELVRLNFDKFDCVPSFNELIILLAREIEPFIIGEGKVLVYETPKGLEVISGDGGGVNNGHVTSAPAHSWPLFDMWTRPARRGLNSALATLANAHESFLRTTGCSRRNLLRFPVCPKQAPRHGQLAIQNCRRPRQA
jgi:hypothetical protein